MDGPMIPYSAEFEKKVFEATKEESKEEEIDKVYEGTVSQMNKIIKTGY